jgi:hypothetical protein
MDSKKHKLRFTRILKITVLFVMTWVLFSSTGQSASLCRQTIMFVGKTEGDTSTLMFYEYVSGECSTPYRQHYLKIGPEGLLDAVFKGSYALTLPLWNDSATNGKRLEEAELLLKSGDAWVMPFGQSIRAPEHDFAFDSTYSESVLVYNKWYGGFFDEPRMDVEADLLYRLPNGLYKNYEIKDAYLMRQSRILFLIIYQPLEKVGLDSMHGVLVYRVKKLQK